jgi:hypothetical protein
MIGSPNTVFIRSPRLFVMPNRHSPNHAADGPQRKRAIADLHHAVRRELRTWPEARSVDIRLHAEGICVTGSVTSEFHAERIVRRVRQLAAELPTTVRLRVADEPCATASAWSPVGARTFVFGVGITATVLLTAAGFYRWQVPTERSLRLYQSPLRVVASGEPAAGAFLTLYPVNGQVASREPRSFGVVGTDGMVSWTTYCPSDGVPTGDYLMTAIWQRPNQDEHQRLSTCGLPEQYRRPESSPLRLVIGPGITHPSQLELLP